MTEALGQMLDRGPAVWTGLGRPRQLGLLGLGLVFSAVLFVGSQWLWEGQYVPLFASLTPEDAGAISAQLKASKTPYRVGGSGDQILVPADKVAEARLRMAVQGLPLGGGVGFEVFDKTSFGLSDFNQRVNYQRALQGELARTIGQLRGVARARVLLVMPPPALFADRERPPSASVFLKLAPGGRLSGEEVRGIVHLVASSIEGLNPERVTVVDTAGRVLAAGSDAGIGSLSPRRSEIKTAVEEGIERRVQSLLDSALGPGQAVTRASAQLNFDQVERTEERFDPTPVTRQETRTVDTTKGSATTPTVPAGAPAPAAPPPPSSTSNESTRESESVSYELSKIVARTLTSPGEIQRLSVSVLLNSNPRVAQRSDKKEVHEPVPRSPEEMDKIRRIVMGAVGYSQARGDEVTVVEMPFDTSLRDREQTLLDRGEPPSPLPTPLGGLGGSANTLVLVAVVAAALALVAWFIRYQARRRALAEVARSLHTQESRSIAGTADFAAATHQPEAPVMAGVPEEFIRISKEREGVRQKALGLASTEPEAAAQLIRAWMVKKKALHPAGAGHDSK